MEDYSRSRSYGNGMMQLETYQEAPPPRPGSYELRPYSVSYAQSQMAANNYNNMGNNSNRDLKLKKVKSTSGSSSSKSWSFAAGPEFQRKKRVASYKMYSVEGKVEGSLRRSFRWLKDKYTQVVYGWW
ncbi:hypothetical protein F3Y22_tig00116975pilonHSYRG00134 [Hibiscus syriacus]|uniref:Uncharacterized protein n=1 Tax=Hibiscus syriacus TaxID=106335 RepID=A0A6A2WIE6_HIBSY|nr:uncharacterized protein LOC120192403 [Hibiscus syriacus]KAE8658051.1 hypothetical protein F3Y22_tig00116975pilonHSYRG00134 [Hibiscus syriacus]